MAKSNVLVALSAFVGEYKGGRVTFSQGDLIEADHPIVAANPHLFGPPTFRYPMSAKAESRVEQATAAPGEKRGH
jgi:hypothetical protein